MRHGKRAKREGAALVAASSGLVLAALPVFLVGGLAVQIRAELGFSEAALGAAVTAAFLISAAGGAAGGRLSDRLGARRAVLAGAGLSVVALVGIAFLARGWWVLAVLLGVSGLSFVFTDPGLAVLIARSVDSRRQGIAFGVKEASIPAATLVAGVAVPVIALTVGWRFALALGVIPLAGLLVALSRLDLPQMPARSVARPTAAPTNLGRPVRMVAVGAALGSTAASGIGVFLTESAVAMGMSPAAAGWLLATGSVAGIATRVGTGFVADRRGGPQLGLMAGMMAVGAASMAAGAVGGAGPFLVAGTVGAFSAGWGWSGLLFFSLVRASPSAPGAAAGIGLAGLAVGNAFGPLTFGALAQAASFSVAWALAAALAAAGATVMWLARAGFWAGSDGGELPDDL